MRSDFQKKKNIHLPGKISSWFFLFMLLTVSGLNQLTAQELTEIRDLPAPEIQVDCVDATLIDPDANCITLYEPVCGCDGVTYDNLCIAETQAGITEWTTGPCTNPCDMVLEQTSTTSDCNSSDVCIAIIGGQAPYTILFDQVAGVDNGQEICFLGLAPGSYYVEVIDANGCVAILQFYVPVIDYYVEATVTPVSCYGGSDGAIDIHIPIDIPLNYHWQGPNGFTADTEDIYGLEAGFYTVRITYLDGGCYAIFGWEVEEPNEIVAEFDITNEDCNGVDGCLYISGGTPDYDVYVWYHPNPNGVDFEPVYDSLGNISVDGALPLDYVDFSGPSTHPVDYVRCANDIPGGVYLLLIVDANGCFTFLTVEIPDVSPITAEFEITSEPCADQVDGCLYIEGGTGPYGVYVFDCPLPLPVDPFPAFDSLGVPYFDNLPTVDWPFIIVDGVICAEDIPAGHYCVLIVDSEGCWKLIRVTVPAPHGFSLEGEVTDVSCHGGSDGAIDLHVSPAPSVSDYHYQWTGPDGFTANTQDIDGLKAGEYIVVVTSSTANCSATATFYVGQPHPLEVGFEITNEDCDGVDGCLYIFGGTPEYNIFVWYHPGPDVEPNPVFIPGAVPTLNNQLPLDFFVWDDTNNGPVDYVRCAENIPAGTYLVLVVDSNGCYKYITVVIPEIDPIVAEFEITSEPCAEQVDGCLHISGGTEPYLIYAFECPSITDVLPLPIFDENGIPSIDNAQEVQLPFVHSGTSICAENIPAGIYCLVIVDAEGCYKLIRIHIPEPNGFSIDGDVTNLSCFGSQDGAIDLHVPAGMNYHFSWTGPDGYTADTEDISGLAAGEYKVVVTKADGTCEARATFYVSQPNPLEVGFEITNEDCDGVDGCLYIHGGTPDYHVFVWYHPAPGNANPLPVFDANGVPTINDQLPLDFINFHPTQVEPVDYVRCATNIPAGIYLVLVVDANGCYTYITVEIPEVEPIHAEFEITSEPCDEEVDGCLYINGGTAPYAIWAFECPLPTPLPYDTIPQWDPNGNPSIGDYPLVDLPFIISDDNVICAENIPAGNYCVVILDAQGCWTVIRIHIPPGNDLSVEGDVTHVSCFGGSDGSIELTISGGVPPYAVQWTNASGVSGNNLYNLEAGVYTVVVKDSRNCRVTKTFTILQPSELTCHFEITSDPCDPEVDACLSIQGGTGPYWVWAIECPQPWDVMPTPEFNPNNVPSIDGVQMTHFPNLDPTIEPGDVICAENIPHGTYCVLIVDANGCYIWKRVVIEFYGIDIRGEVTHISCGGTDDGAIDITVSGGTPPYYYEWSNGETTEDISGLSAGTYTVYVYSSDDFCTATATFVVEEFDAIITNCSWDPYGSFACVDPTGGTEPYTIVWYDLNTGAIINDDNLYCIYDLEPGAYMVVITDANGCQASEIFIVEERPCLGGIAVVTPDEIESGGTTTFWLWEWSGVALQWQFMTENTDWVNIPGATTPEYHTPSIHVGHDKEIKVRAKVICADGSVVYSEIAWLYVFGTLNSESDAIVTDDRDLFNGEPVKIIKEEVVDVFPTVTDGPVTVQFNRDRAEEANIYLRDLSGRVIETRSLDETFNGTEERFDLSGRAKGMYLINIERNGIINSYKIVIQ